MKRVRKRKFYHVRVKTGRGINWIVQATGWRDAQRLAYVLRGKITSR